MVGQLTWISCLTLAVLPFGMGPFAVCRGLCG